MKITTQSNPVWRPLRASLFQTVKLLSICLLLDSSPLEAGQPQPVSGFLNLGQNYPIPTGKILLLDCLSFSYGNMQVEVGGGYVYGPASVSGTSFGGTLTFPRPLKLPAGSKIQITSAPAGAPVVSFYGTLIDIADFYVMAPSNFDSVSKTSSGLQAKLSINDKAPAIVRVEKSVDLKSWNSDTNTSTIPKGNETNLVLNINAQSTTNAFFRARVVRRD
jgi:hypothetical protein